MGKCFPAKWPPHALSMTTSIISGIITVIATCGNALIIIAVVWNPNQTLHEPFNYFLVNLAISDLILGAFTMPISCFYHYKESMGKTDSTFVELLHYSYFISSMASLLSFLSLCVDRYIAVAKPVEYRQYLSWSRCLLVSLGIWLISLSVPLLHMKLHYVEYMMLFENVAVLLGFIMLIVIYCRVYRFLKKQTCFIEKHVSLESKYSKLSFLKRIELDKRVTRVFLTMVFIFVVTYLPALALTYVLEFCDSCDCETHNILRDAVILTISFNCCINPFFCTLRLKNFSQAAKRIFLFIMTPFFKIVKESKGLEHGDVRKMFLTSTVSCGGILNKRKEIPQQRQRAKTI